MRKVKPFGILALIAIIASLAVTACKPEEEIECGSLTITNLPSVPAGNWFGEQVQWLGAVYYNEEITTQIQLHNLTVSDSNEVANFLNPDRSFSSTSPFSLLDSRDYLKGFLKSGDYLVHIQPLDNNANFEYRALMTNVTFKEGKATINYNDMTLYYSLPER